MRSVAGDLDPTSPETPRHIPSDYLEERGGDAECPSLALKSSEK
jgi:hypothetical protein